MLEYGSIVGYGHISRCSVIIKESVRFGWENYLLTKSRENLPSIFLSLFSGVCKTIKQSYIDDINHCVKKYNISTIILDSYDIDYNLLKQKISKCIHIYRFSKNVDLDDVSSRIINYNPVYNNLYSKRHLLGSKFSLVNERFGEVLSTKVSNNVFVFFGGGGDFGALIDFEYYFIFLAEQGFHVNLIITSSYKNIIDIKKFYDKSSSITVLVDDPIFPHLLNNSEFAVVAGGTIIYEAIYLMIPMQVITVASNQIPQSRCWHELGCIDYIGEHVNVNSKDLITSYQKNFSTIDMINGWKSRQKGKIDLRGAKRILQHMEKDHHNNN